MPSKEALKYREETIATYDGIIQGETDPTQKQAAIDFIAGMKAQWAAQDLAEQTAPVTPAPVPAASDAWRNAAPGTIVTMEGISYVVEENSFGNFIRKIKTPPAPAAPPTIAEERAANAKYATGVLSATDDENVQASWMAYLAWLSKR